MAVAFHGLHHVLHDASLVGVPVRESEASCDVEHSFFESHGSHREEKLFGPVYGFFAAHVTCVALGVGLYLVGLGAAGGAEAWGFKPEHGFFGKPLDAGERDRLVALHGRTMKARASSTPQSAAPT